MASIKKRGPNQWQARVRRKGWPLQIKTFDSKADAQAWARQMESEMDRGVWISRSEAENTTLEEALDRYAQEYIPRLSHPGREHSRVKQIKQYPLAARMLASIRTTDINEYIKSRKKSVGAKTINLELALLSRLFNVAAADWGMESLRNPVERATKPKTPRGRERRLGGKEEEKLLETCSANLRSIIQFALETAMRREEIASLRWEQVDFKQRVVYLSETKNGESRCVPLSPKAIEILQSMLPENVTSIYGNVFNRNSDSISKAFSRACKRANIEDLRFHDLRHEATSRLFENTDLDVMEIRSITGHKSMQMLARYSHLRTHRLADRLAGKSRGA